VPGPEAAPAAAKPPAGLELLDLDDLAAVFKCSRRTITRMRAKGQLPGPDIHVCSQPRWRAATILAFIDRQARRSGEGR
jgi:hypothetical protein